MESSDIAKVVVYVMLFCFLVSVILMWLWNYIMPFLFDLPTINFWQALCVWLLSNLLFGSSNAVSKK